MSHRNIIYPYNQINLKIGFKYTNLSLISFKLPFNSCIFCTIYIMLKYNKYLPPPNFTLEAINLDRKLNQTKQDLVSYQFSLFGCQKALLRRPGLWQSRLNPPFERLSSHIGMLNFGCSTFIQFPSKETEGSTESPQHLNPCQPHGSQNGVPSSWFRPELNPAIRAIQGMNQQKEDISLCFFSLPLPLLPYLALLFK